MTRSDTTHLALAKNALIRLPGTARDIHCDSGTLWITQDGDLRDIVLEPGQQFRVDGKRAPIVHALAAAQRRVRHELPGQFRGESRSAQPNPQDVRRSLAVRPRALALE